MKKLEELHVRDPFILPVKSKNKYYMFGTTARHAINGPWDGFNAYISEDTINWIGPILVFKPPINFWGSKYFWAPEVYKYSNSYYMFASFGAHAKNRGVLILKAENPDGPFEPWSEGPVTTPEWMCIDGTLFIDDNEKPWLIFVHEWVQIENGTICAIPLKRDLKSSYSKPIELFKATDASWVQKYTTGNYSGFITDGPFMHRCVDGSLLMLWASYGENQTYMQGVAKSTSGLLKGPWVQTPEPLYSNDGGHGMLFKTFEGNLFLTVHTPNDFGKEHPIFIPIKENNGLLIKS